MWNRFWKRISKDMEDKEKNYEELVAELESLVAGIEDPAKSLSEVSKDVQRAMVLLMHCREKLRVSEVEVKKSLSAEN